MLVEYVKIFINNNFFRSAIAWQDSITKKILPLVFIFTLYSFIIALIFDEWYDADFEIGPFEISGAFIGLLLVFRVNAGYDRWWEARKLWGGIVNQSRNLAIAAHNYGPQDVQWQKQMAVLIAAFSHATRQQLREEKDPFEFKFLDNDLQQDLLLSSHMPNTISNRIAFLLEDYRQKTAMDGFAFLQIDKERALLIDHMGACERILKTPIPLVVDIKIRRFLFIFLLWIPFLLIQKVGIFCPLMMLIIAYPLLGLDQIGIELQNPFRKKNLSHLPLNDICNNIQKNVFEIFKYQDNS